MNFKGIFNTQKYYSWIVGFTIIAITVSLAILASTIYSNIAKAIAALILILLFVDDIIAALSSEPVIIEKDYKIETFNDKKLMCSNSKTNTKNLEKIKFDEVFIPIIITSIAGALLIFFVKNEILFSLFFVEIITLYIYARVHLGSVLFIGSFFAIVVAAITGLIKYIF